jgi:hypothetical protein
LSQNRWTPLMLKSIAFALPFVMAAGTAAAQYSEAEMRAMIVPPAAWDAGKNMSGNTGNWYGYFFRPSVGHPTGPQDMSWAVYNGDGITQGGTGVFWGDWGNPVAPPVNPNDPNSPDSCSHTHVSYGVWGLQRVRIRILWIDLTTVSWAYLGGGTKSGVRVNGRCEHKADNPLKNIDPRYGWGVDAVVFNLHPFCVGVSCTAYDAVALGVVNMSHGSGDCPGVFACTSPGWLLGYTVP